MNHNTQNYIAIDIAKESLQIQTPNKSFEITYDDAGLKDLLTQIKQWNEPMVICEATGGYERELMQLLFKHHIAVALVNPARVRAFAQSEGIKAKTDPIDALVLMRFAQEKRPSPATPPEPAREKLAALLDRRSQLSEQIAREKNRLQKCPKSIHRSINKMMRFINKELKAIDANIRKQISSDEKMQNQSDIMQSVSGVGEITTWTILAYLSEIENTSRNQIVALAGIAPYNRDSGKTNRKRVIQGGRQSAQMPLHGRSIRRRT